MFFITHIISVPIPVFSPADLRFFCQLPPDLHVTFAVSTNKCFWVTINSYDRMDTNTAYQTERLEFLITAECLFKWLISPFMFPIISINFV